MTTTMRRVLAVIWSAALMAALGPRAGSAADLPLAPERAASGAERYAVARPYANRPYPALQWPVYPDPHRFDIYGHPLDAYGVTLPDPLVVDNGCPKAIEPTYDVDGNLAGYAPLVACR